MSVRQERNFVSLVVPQNCVRATGESQAVLHCLRLPIGNVDFSIFYKEVQARESKTQCLNKPLINVVKVYKPEHTAILHTQ